jgi:penicillin amidase
MNRRFARRALVTALLACCACAPAAPRRPAAPHAGLARPVRIVTDRWGIPHLMASSLPDLYFAWGYVTARDRLWQLVVQRQAGDGTLWKWFGNSTLNADGGAQLFGLRERAEAAWAQESRDSTSAMALERYASGINAYLARCRSGAARWPAELEALGVRPEDWRPADTIVMLLGEGVQLDLDIPELAEAPAVARHGRAWALARRRFERQWIYDTIPDSAAIRLYGGRGAPRAARDPGSGPPLHVEPRLLAAARASLEAWRPPEASDPEQRASDVFAVGAARSASGFPLLANDTHLPLTIPGPLHALHVTVPGIVDAIGFAVPGIPVIVSGRNARCAWGVTSLGADVVDVYADTLSADGGSVRWKGGWAPIRTRGFDLRFRLLGIPLPVLGQVRRYTPHGPVVLYDRKHRIALSARWAGVLDSLAIGPLLGVERSSSALEVREHFRALATPCLNVVAADRAGRLVYQASGSVPRRDADPGRLPLPGDGAHEWHGFIAHDRLPGWQAPPGGFVVNCNNRPVGLAYSEPLPGYDWAQDRALEIAGRLERLRRISLADLRSIQNDVHSRGAERMLPRLIACADSLPARWTPREREALDTLRHWDALATRGQVAPTLYRGWFGALQRRSRLEGLTGLMAAALDGRAPESLLDPVSGRPERPAEAALTALGLALDSLQALLGPDLETWTWERAHRAVFKSAMGSRPGAWQPPPTPVEGDNSTPCVGPSRLPWSTAVTFGPTFRHLVDLAVADSSLAVLPPGNSGAWRSGHVFDHLQRWANHDYVPFYLSWELVERAKESETTLEPVR